MALAETAELVAEMSLRGDFPRQAARMQSSLRGLNARTADLQKALGKIGTGLRKGFKAGMVGAGAAVGFLAYQVSQGIESLAELEDVTNATSQVIESTGGVAGVTAESVRELAERYEDLTTVDDKVIQRAENLLLTFTNVRRKAFEPAIAAALDMSQALGTDLDSTVRSLGKALQDPAVGLTRLTRLGVTFTEKEKEKITTLAKSGRTMEAQQVILRKLNRLYGGRAATAARGYRGAVNRLKDGIEGLQQSLARPLLRPLTQVTNKLAKFANTADVQAGIRGIGEAFASLFKPSGPTAMDAFESGLTGAPDTSAFEDGLNTLKDTFNTVKSLPWESIRGGLDRTFQIASKAVDLFKGLPPELQTALVTLLAANKLTGGLVASGLKDIAGIALKSLTTIMANVVTVVGKSVVGPGDATPIGPATGPAATSAATIGAGRVALMTLGAAAGAAAANAILIQGDLTPGNLATRVMRGGGGEPSSMQFGVGTGMTAKELLDLFNNMIRIEVGRTNGGAGIVDGQIRSSGTRVGFSTAEAAAALNAIRSGTETVAQNSGIQLSLVPVSNDILDRIASETTTAVQDGKTANERLYNIPTDLKPFFGTIAGAVDRNTAVTSAKDMSVKVSVASTVTATTVAQGVSRVTNQNRVVID